MAAALTCTPPEEANVSQQFEVVFTAEGEVTRPEHAEECLAAHPNQPCPGYPHEEG